MLARRQRFDGIEGLILVIAVFVCGFDRKLSAGGIWNSLQKHRSKKGRAGFRCRDILYGQDFLRRCFDSKRCGIYKAVVDDFATLHLVQKARNVLVVLTLRRRQFRVFAHALDGVLAIYFICISGDTGKGRAVRLTPEKVRTSPTSSAGFPIVSESNGT